MRARPEVPPEIAQEIAAQAATLVRESLAMAGEAVRLQRLFDDADLPVLFVKGASLAMLAYGNLGLRHARTSTFSFRPRCWSLRRHLSNALATVVLIRHRTSVMRS